MRLIHSAAIDGVIPYVQCVSFLSHEDLLWWRGGVRHRLYIKPIKHWFSKIIIPSSSLIEAEAWSICSEISIVFASLPTVPILYRISSALHCPNSVYVPHRPLRNRLALAEALVQSDTNEAIKKRGAEESVDLLTLHDLTEEEWCARRTSYEVRASPCCEQ